MRNAFARTLVRGFERYPNVMLVTGDLGYSALEAFRDRFPDRYVNAGVAEQNMIGVSAGLAMSGRNVFAYSIAPFATMRGFEHVRNDIAYQNLPVKIVGVGGGFSYGHQGPTHFTLEDISIMRSLANMTVVSPVDPFETEAVTQFAIRYRGPMYIRLGKAGEKNMFSRVPKFSLGRFSTIVPRGDVAIFGAGPVAYNALEAVQRLREKGIACKVIAASSIQPIDRDSIRAHAVNSRFIVTLEEHNTWGGLGSAVAEVLAEGGFGVPLVRLGVSGALSKRIGSQDYLRGEYGLSSEGIAKTIAAYYRKYKK